MAAFKFLSLATAAIFLLDTKGTNASTGTTTANKAVSVDCSAAMNAARNRVGFTELIAGKDAGEILPIDSTEVDGRPAAKTAALNGTYAHVVQEGANADCEAAVDYWKAALPNFTGLPPTYTAETGLYKNSQNVSFISLFNPKENPKVDCAYFTCPAKQVENTPPEEEEEEEEVPTVPESGKLPEGKITRTVRGSFESREVSTTEKEVKALVCITTPSALTENTAPYTQSQWDQITTGLNGSGAAAVPSLLGLATAAVGVLLL
ncbi:SAG family member [Eimeria brunetti]|uniref:SAG family member n=1 Tax=Eimeria brunetti TaxID=51314 RepID=U6LQ37_9EIME|nr:SAG family member [Eimeria brunetti]